MTSQEHPVGSESPPRGSRPRAAWAFGRFGGRVLAFLIRLLGDRDEAEGLAQEVFLRFLRERGPFETEGAVRVWLFRVAKNLALDQGKKRRPHLMGDSLADWPQEAGPSPSLEERETLAGMQSALQALPRIYRQTLILRFLEGLEYEELARVEGVSQSALRTRVQKGLELLRLEMGLPARTGRKKRTGKEDYRSGSRI